MGIFCSIAVLNGLMRTDLATNRSLSLLLDSRQFRKERVRNANVCKPSFRFYEIPKSDKIYMIVSGENGVFGIKLNANEHFEGDKSEFIEKMQQMRPNPITWPKQECRIEEWQWRNTFQNKNCLTMFGKSGMRSEWVPETAKQFCQWPNVEIDEKNEAN